MRATALISVVDYRLLPAIVAVAIGGCALLLLLIRPAPEPADAAADVRSAEAGAAGSAGSAGSAGLDPAATSA